MRKIERHYLADIRNARGSGSAGGGGNAEDEASESTRIIKPILSFPSRRSLSLSVLSHGAGTRYEGNADKSLRRERGARNHVPRAGSLDYK